MSKRIPLLDAARGLLSIGVASFHASRYAWDPSGLADGTMYYLWKFIHIGSAVRVPLFFSISGFVLTMALTSPHVDAKCVRDFIARRLVRVTPLWWISILFSIAVESCFAIKHKAEVPIPDTVHLFSNLVYLNFIVGKDSLNYPGYTLCIEVQNYAVIGLITCFSFLLAKHRVAVFSLVMVGTLVVANAASPYVDHTVWLIGFWPWFAIGSLCYLRTQKLISREFMTASVLSFGLSQSRNPDIERGLLITSTIFVIYGLSEFDLTSKIWNMGRQFTFLSRYSFALFLLHIKFVAHGITFDKARAYLGLHPNFTFFILVLLPLLLAIAITPVMNRIDKFLMAKLFPRANK